jgi:Domain of unknown function (DUF4385)
MDFDYTLDFASTNFRARPELYRIVKGEQGVLPIHPYKRGDPPHQGKVDADRAVAMRKGRTDPGLRQSAISPLRS